MEDAHGDVVTPRLLLNTSGVISCSFGKLARMGLSAPDRGGGLVVQATRACSGGSMFVSRWARPPPPASPSLPPVVSNARLSSSNSLPCLALGKQRDDALHGPRGGPACGVILHRLFAALTGQEAEG